MTVHGSLFRGARGARAFTALSAAGAVLSLGVLAAAPGAQAAPGPARHAATRVLPAAGRHAAPAAIRCKVYVVIRYPHPLDATGKVICSGKVRRITLRVSIYRGTRVVRSQAFSRTGTRSLKRTVFTACHSGRYHAVTLAKVRTKSGHVLRGGVRTRTVSVHC